MDSVARMLHLLFLHSAASRLRGADSETNLQEAMPPTRTHPFANAYRWRFFLRVRNADGQDLTVKGRDDEACDRIVAKR
jgi:hypothetical protein